MQINGNINTAGGNFSGVEINLDVSVGGCNPNMPNDIIINHTDNNGKQGIKIEKMVSQVDWYVPFKVKVKASDRDKLLNTDILPCNVFVTKFREPTQPSEIFS